MLSGTKELLQDLVGKIQLLDLALDTINRVHKDNLEEVDAKVRVISTHKLKLVDEIIRLSI